MYKSVTFVIAALFCLVSLNVTDGNAVAASKIGIIKATEVLSNSNDGKEIQKAIEAKAQELKAGLKADNDEFIALQKEFQKKSSAWSETVKTEKEIELKKMRRDLGNKQDDANLELNKFREEKMKPLVQKLNTVLQTVAKDKGIDLILDSHVVAYSSDSIDLTEAVTEALNKAK